MTISHSHPGTYITFEGTDGAGKSTQIEALAAELRAQGKTVHLIREPGGTLQGELLRALIKGDTPSMHDALVSCGADHQLLSAAFGFGSAEAPDGKLTLPQDSSDRTRMFMLNAARAELFEKVIVPALAAGDVVLGDRGYHSTLAYQGGAGTLDDETILANCLQATGGIQPDMVVYCRLDNAVRMERMKARGMAEDAIERSTNFNHVADKFDELAADNPDMWRVVDASQTIEQVADAVQSVVGNLIVRKDSHTRTAAYKASVSARDTSCREL